jgi:pyruvate,water dikinase
MKNLIPIEEATAGVCGGKAPGLRGLLELGFPVPPGVCLPVAVYRAALPSKLPPAGAGADLALVEAFSRPVVEHLALWQPAAPLYQALDRTVRQLGWPLAVRSSATCEDRPEIPAPGVFTSELDVANRQELVEAVRSCWSSLWGVPAWAVLRRRSSWPGGEGMAVILQRQVRARRAGLVLSREARDGPGQMRLEWVEGPGHPLASGLVVPRWLTLPREGPIPAAAGFEVEELGRLRDAALGAEGILGGTVELEWAAEGDEIWLLQVRPVSCPAPVPVELWRSDDPEVVWRWDREHNPEPLSPAHISLMERLDPSGGFMVRQGYLFYAERDERAEAEEAPSALEPVWERFLGELDQRLGQLEAELPGLERAVSLFNEIFEAYFGHLARERRAAQSRFARFARQLNVGPEQAALLTVPAGHATLQRAEELYRLSRVVRKNSALAAVLGHEPLEPASFPDPGFAAEWQVHLGRYGALSACWDVASPSVAERPVVLGRRLLALAAVEHDPGAEWRRRSQQARELQRNLMGQLSAKTRQRFQEHLHQARLARRVEEEDDLLFARALGLVRQALLAVGCSLTQRGWLDRPDQVFLLRIEEIAEASRALEQTESRAPAALSPGVLEQRRAEWDARRSMVPPLTIQGERLVLSPPPSLGRVVLRGVGTGGVVRGRVRLVTRLEQMLARGEELRGAVVVCPTLIPALAVVLPEVAALVTDHGGLLSHAACLARELGKVAVVGTGVATRQLEEGEVVWVDGGRGLVVRDDVT